MGQHFAFSIPALGYFSSFLTRAQLECLADRFEAAFACSARLQWDYGLILCHGYRF